MKLPSSLLDEDEEEPEYKLLVSCSIQTLKSGDKTYCTVNSGVIFPWITPSKHLPITQCIISTCGIYTYCIVMIV